MMANKNLYHALADNQWHPVLNEVVDGPTMEVDVSSQTVDSIYDQGSEEYKFNLFVEDATIVREEQDGHEPPFIRTLGHVATISVPHQLELITDMETGRAKARLNQILPKAAEDTFDLLRPLALPSKDYPESIISLGSTSIPSKFSEVIIVNIDSKHRLCIAALHEFHHKLIGKHAVNYTRPHSAKSGYYQNIRVDNLLRVPNLNIYEIDQNDVILNSSTVPADQGNYIKDVVKALDHATEAVCEQQTKYFNNTDVNFWKLFYEETNAKNE